jgi:hypothetical protein
MFREASADPFPQQTARLVGGHRPGIVAAPPDLLMSAIIGVDTAT